jgi:uncharacterized protein (DUF427 family)
MKAIWNDTVLAESDDTVVVENNHYFPASSLRREFFQPSQTHTTCGWKGVASYYDVVIGDAKNADAAWFYPEPMKGAEQVQDRVAFWKGVTVSA